MTVVARFVDDGVGKREGVSQGISRRRVPSAHPHKHHCYRRLALLTFFFFFLKKIYFSSCRRGMRVERKESERGKDKRIDRPLLLCTRRKQELFKYLIVYSSIHPSIYLSFETRTQTLYQGGTNRHHGRHREMSRRTARSDQQEKVKVNPESVFEFSHTSAPALLDIRDINIYCNLYPISTFHINRSRATFSFLFFFVWLGDLM